MTITLSERVERIQPSVTLGVAARAKERAAQGHDIIDLSVGEPDFDTPEFIKEAAVQALRAGHTKYTAVEGTLSLRRAIAAKFARENRLNYAPDQILVSAGAKQSLSNLCLALLNPGDEAIIPAPYWVSYPDMVLLADGVPVILPTTLEQRFTISPEQLEAAITPRTRLLVLNSPSNPTGIAYSAAMLRELAAVLLRHPQVWVVSDDIYEHIRWVEEPFLNILNVCPELAERTVVVNGVSKVYAMTGWRIGYAAGPKRMLDAMKKVQSQTTSGANSIAQDAAEAALGGGQAEVVRMVQEFKRRHDVVVERVRAIPGMNCLAGDGTFYTFIDASCALTDAVPTDTALADYLLDVAQVAVVPGSGFGAPGYIRISYATSMEQLEQALERISNAIKAL